eukprot:11955-Heterococcus_DN1.PRE.3
MCVYSLLLAAAPHTQIAVRRLFKAVESTQRDTTTPITCTPLPADSATATATATGATPLASGMQILHHIPFAGAATTAATAAPVVADALGTSATGDSSAATVTKHSAQLSHCAVVTAETVDSGYVSDVSEDDNLCEAQFDRYDSVYASSAYNMSASKQHINSNRLSVSTGSLSSLDSSVHSSSNNSSSSGATAVALLRH